MLRLVAEDTHGSSVCLPTPLSLRIRMEEDVPADDLYAVFPYFPVGELCGLTLYDGGRVLFRGVMDEQEHIVRTNGEFLRIAARSLAAHLLDNEAAPRCYDHPSAKFIYERHAADYGITAGDPDDATCFGELNITKGMSNWGVISAFCRACYSGTPRVSADGTLYLKGTPRGETAVFGDGGIPYTEMTDSVRRCEELSSVNVKLNPDDGYGYRIDNNDAISRGIRRERYLNAMLGGQTIRSADVMLDKSRQKAHTVTLKCVGRHLSLLGCDGVIVGRNPGEKLCVCAVQYRMDSNGEYTVVKLRRRTESCGYLAM